MIAKMRALRARAQQLGDAAEQRYHAALVAEFHPRTDEQRKLLFERGRAEVLHRDRTLCWRYLKDGVRDVFCWNRAGQLADHTRVDETAVEFNRVGYLAAMFASDDCYSSDCAKRGWDTKRPGGRELQCRCESSDCLTRGAHCE